MADELTRLKLSPQVVHDLAMLEPSQYDAMSEDTRRDLFSALVITCVELYDGTLRIARIAGDELAP